MKAVVVVVVVVVVVGRSDGEQCRYSLKCSIDDEHGHLEIKEHVARRSMSDSLMGGRHNIF